MKETKRQLKLHKEKEEPRNYHFYEIENSLLKVDKD